MRRHPAVWKQIVKYIREYEFRIVFVLFVIVASLIIWQMYRQFTAQRPSTIPLQTEYMATLETHKKTGKFPYRYLQDQDGNLLPIVAVTGFFRDQDAENTYYEYIDHGIKVIGVTAYKTFPKPITDASEDKYHVNNPFNYVHHIKHWLCCMKNPEQYGFTSENKLVDISESDFYDVDDTPVTKKYDVIYICLNDHETEEKPCPADGWNAINRNFQLAKECFPIMIQEYGLKILVMGRTKCGLEEQFGNNIETVDFLPYHEFKEKLYQSRMLFVPNIYDASPRVIAESICKGLPVLMNRKIVCGTKYVNEETGELFTDQHDIRGALDSLLKRMPTMSPKQWWSQNYGRKVAGQRFRNFLAECYPDTVGSSVQEVYF